MSEMLIQLRGTSGSGKSTAVRALMKRYGAHPIFDLLGPRSPEAYRLIGTPFKSRLYVLGPYLAPCGGCDAIGNMETVIKLLRAYSAKGGDVIFEGLLISSMYGSIGQFLEGYGKDALIAFLTTSRERCYQQLRKRQSEGRARGNKSFDRHYDGTQRVKQRMLKDGRVRVEELDPDHAVTQIATWLTGQ
jgi:hypothetical protein